MRQINVARKHTDDGHPVFTAESANGSCFVSFSISIPKEQAEKYPDRLPLMEAACIKAVKIALNRMHFAYEPLDIEAQKSVESEPNKVEDGNTIQNGANAAPAAGV